MITIAAFLGLTASLVSAGEVKLSNPSFEKGTGGFWINNLKEISINTNDSNHGRQCLSVSPVKSKTINVVFFTDYKPDTIYTVSYDCKAEKAGQDSRIQFAVMAQGKKPISFLPKLKIAPVNPKTEWSTSTASFGPVKSKIMGREVKKLAIFINVVKNEKGGTVLIDNISLSTKPASAEPAAETKKKMK
jgi:hypothetical protein